MRSKHKKTFAQSLLELRQALGLSQEAFSSKIGIPFRTYHNMEQGKTTRIEVEALAALRGLGFDVDAFLGGPPHVAAPDPGSQSLSPGLSANTMRRLALEKDGAITDESVPKEWQVNDQFLYEFGAWTRRMLIMDLNCQPQLIKRIKQVMAEFERDVENQVKDETPPGQPAGAARNQGGGSG